MDWPLSTASLAGVEASVVAATSATAACTSKAMTSAVPLLVSLLTRVPNDHSTVRPSALTVGVGRAQGPLPQDRAAEADRPEDPTNTSSAGMLSTTVAPGSVPSGTVKDRR